MSSSVAEVRPAVAGFVEAVTETAVLGWAWSPGSAAPLPVELRLDNEVVATATADGMREDLARNGIGEGRHAFTLPVPDRLRSRLSEMRVMVQAPDGAVVPLGSPPVEDGVAERLTQVQRGIEMLVGSHRVLHRNLQAVMVERAEQKPEPAAAPAPDPAAVQALQEGLATVELFVARLEVALAGMARPQGAAEGPRWVLAGLAGASATALVLSIWALLRVLPA